MLVLRSWCFLMLDIYHTFMPLAGWLGQWELHTRFMAASYFFEEQNWDAESLYMSWEGQYIIKNHCICGCIIKNSSLRNTKVENIH